jgi:hippurate hydrolase
MICWLLTGLMLVTTPAPGPAAPVPLAPVVERELGSLQELYRALHTRPELSFQERETARRLAAELRRAGIEVTEGVGGHGVVGVLRNGPGPVVLVRTDLDALPVREETGLPYASSARGTNDAGVEVPVMHACGHDLHMANLVGVARVLGGLRDRWSGTVVFIGQPAEERGAGARAMLADGLYRRFPKPDFGLALHVNAEMPAGTVGVTEGHILANVDSVDITIRGLGGHGAWPHRTKDPVVLAAQTVLALQTIVSRETDPLDSAVVTVGSIHGGTKHNIIPDEVRLQLTVRSFTDEVRAHTLEAIRRIVRGQAVAAGMPEDRLPLVGVAEREFTPSCYNEPALVQRLQAVLTRELGADRVLVRKPGMGGEDFAEYGRTADRIPIMLFWLGSVDPEKVAAAARTSQALPSLHSSKYHPLPEPSLRTGVTAMTAAVLDLLRK